MIDIHNHVLYNLDDGAKTDADTVAMLKEAVHEGIISIVCTPHYHYQTNQYSQDDYITSFEAANRIIEEHQIPIRLYKGNELYLNDLSIQDLIDGSCLTMASSRYVLVEWQSSITIKSLLHLFYQLKVHGYMPIVAHYERLIQSKEDIKKVETLLEVECLIQVNANSIIKPKNRFQKKHIHQLFKRNSIHFVASDSHNTSSRSNQLSKARERVSKRYGEDMANKVFYENQLKLLSNVTYDQF